MVLSPMSAAHECRDATSIPRNTRCLSACRVRHAADAPMPACVDATMKASRLPAHHDILRRRHSHFTPIGAWFCRRHGVSSLKQNTPPTSFASPCYVIAIALHARTAYANITSAPLTRHSTRLTHATTLTIAATPIILRLSRTAAYHVTSFSATCRHAAYCRRDATHYHYAYCHTYVIARRAITTIQPTPSPSPFHHAVVVYANIVNSPRRRRHIVFAKTCRRTSAANIGVHCFTICQHCLPTPRYAAQHRKHYVERATTRRRRRRFAAMFCRLPRYAVLSHFDAR